MNPLRDAAKEARGSWESPALTYFRTAPAAKIHRTLCRRRSLRTSVRYKTNPIKKHGKPTKKNNIIVSDDVSRSPTTAAAQPAAENARAVLISLLIDLLPFGMRGGVAINTGLLAGTHLLGEHLV